MTLAKKHACSLPSSLSLFTLSQTPQHSPPLRTTPLVSSSCHPSPSTMAFTLSSRGGIATTRAGAPTRRAGLPAAPRLPARRAPAPAPAIAAPTAPTSPPNHNVDLVSVMEVGRGWEPELGGAQAPLFQKRRPLPLSRISCFERPTSAGGRWRGQGAANGLGEECS